MMEGQEKVPRRNLIIFKNGRALLVIDAFLATFSLMILFADAETRENDIQNIFDINLASNFSNLASGET